MKIINGKNAILGRLASYVAKQALKGEEIVILNCEQVIVTGNRTNIKEKFEGKRGRVGSSQKGPKHSRTSDKIVKRTIRGMLPDHRKGRGKIAFKKIKVAALGFSEKAREKLMKSKSDPTTISEEIKKNPDAKGVKVLR